MRTARLLLLSFCIMFFGRPAYAQEDYSSVGLFTDQDFMLYVVGLDKIASDRNYTMGAGFYWSNSSMGGWPVFRPNDWILRRFGSNKARYSERFYSLVLANGSFTPRDLRARTPITNDRPYASLTYLQTNANYVKPFAGRMHSLSLSLGMLGTGVSREAQTAIHNRLNGGDTTKHSPTPRGWGFQISEKGAPTALVSWQETYLITQKHKDNPRTFGGEWKAAWRLDAGWYSMAAAEVSYRVGWIDGRNWTYTNNPLGTSNKAANPNAASYRSAFTGRLDTRPKSCEFYAFGTLRTNLVGYNVLLSGQGGADAVNLPTSQVRRGVLDGAVGVCVSPVICNLNIDLKSKFNFRSPEFEAPGRAPRWHYWIGIDAVFTCFK